MRLVFLAAAIGVGMGPASAEAPPGTAPAARAPAADMPVIDPAPGGAECPPISRYHARKRGGPLTPRTLDELPDADTYKAVYRLVNGCQVPVIARYGVLGSPSARARR